MKYIGKNGLRVADKKVWHEGNFNPSSKSDTGHAHTKANITDFPTSLPANGGNADTVDGKHYSDITNYVDSGIDGIEIGGRNLFKLSDILNIDAYVGATSTGSHSGDLNFTSNRTCIVVEVEEFETYSISYKEHKQGTRFSFGFYTGYQGEVSPATVGKFDWWQFPESDGKFEGYTVPQGCNYLIVYFDRIAFNINSIPVGFKVEKGNKATDWTPAPEDVQAEIDKKADKTELPTKLSELTKDIDFDERYYTETEANTLLGGKVDNSRVLTNVPSGAKFTDTITTVNGKTGTISKADIVALGIPAQDTVYTHPSTHPASMITESAAKRFVSDTEKSNWNNKAEVSDIPTKVGQLQNDKNYVTQSELGEAGLGDMVKAVYDTNNNGVVDNAEKLGGQPPNYYQQALGYTPVNKAGDSMTGTLVVDGKNLPSGADIVTMKRGSGTNRFVLETQDKAMQAFMEAGAVIGLMGTITASDFRIRTNYTDRVSIRGSDGNVGIGTTSPTQKLDVNGKIRMRTQTAAADGDDIVTTKKYVDDGLVTKADKTQVLTNVPADAKFTDTTYTEVTTAEIDAGTASTLRTITGRRIKYVLDKVQGWISALTKADIGLANVDNVKQATKTEFDTHNGDTTKHITAAERTSWNGKWAYNENTIKAVKVNNAVNADTVNGKTVAVDVPSGAKFTDTVYTHPATHPPSIITQDASNRFVTDTEKAAWNGKEPAFTKNTAFNKNFGTTAGTVCQGNDSRLSDARTPTAHTHTKAQITDMPTRLSQFQNDIGAGAGLNIVVSPTEPPGLLVGDWWYKEI